MNEAHLKTALTAAFAFLIALMITSCDIENNHSNICKDLAAVKFQNHTICVTHDYYMVKGIRTPVDMPTARQIAEDKKMMLPTPEIVDAIWQQADIRLKPIPLTPGPQMTGRAYYIRHNDLINDQLSQYDTKDKLIVGHKKDIVYISPQSSRVAIYGWHRLNGIPIQPYSTVHGRYYYDYSHGLRLVSPIAYDSENNPVDLKKILERG